MRRPLWIYLFLFVFLGVGLFWARPVTADSQQQVSYATPTARPDGRVVYIVQEGDSCLRIQLLTGVTVAQLISLNRLDQACTLIPGKELLLAVIVPQPTPTQNPNITPTPLLPTPTPYNGNGQVCVQLFNDVNGDASREDTELPLAGGAVSISDRLGQVSKTANTTDEDTPVCVDIPEGEYNISMAIPSGYNATTTMNLQSVKVQAGDMAILEFGAQVSSAPQVQAQAPIIDTPTPPGTGLLLAILGGMFVLMGIGLGVYVVLGRRG
jgi:hypothetical protein